MIKGLTAFEKEIVRKGLNSPTFIDIILNGKSSNELSNWFMDVSSKNLGEYIKFILFACLIVDCFSQKGDSATEIIKSLGAFIKKPVTPLGLSYIAKLSKPVKIAEPGKGLIQLPVPVLVQQRQIPQRVTMTKKRQLLLPAKIKVTRNQKTRTRTEDSKVHNRKKVTKTRRGRRRAK